MDEGKRGIYRDKKQRTFGPRGCVRSFYTAVQRLSRTSKYYPTINPKNSIRPVLLSVRLLYYSQNMIYYLLAYVWRSPTVRPYYKQ
jgi:hypothetical protein